MSPCALGCATFSGGLLLCSCVWQHPAACSPEIPALSPMHCSQLDMDFLMLQGAAPGLPKAGNAPHTSSSASGSTDTGRPRTVLWGCAHRALLVQGCQGWKQTAMLWLMWHRVLRRRAVPEEPARWHNVMIINNIALLQLIRTL